MKINRYKITIIIMVFIFNILNIKISLAQQALSTNQYSCFIATYEDYIFTRQGALDPVINPAPGPINLAPGKFIRVPCGDPTFVNIYTRTSNGLLGTYTAAESQNYNNQYRDRSYLLGWTAFVVPPGNNAPLCISSRNNIISYTGCSQGATQLNGLSLNINGQQQSYNFTVSASPQSDLRSDYLCKTSRVGGVILDVPCDSPVANLFYHPNNPETCETVDSNLPVSSVNGNSTVDIGYSSQQISCPTNPSYTLTCNYQGSLIDCNDAPRQVWADGRSVNYSLKLVTAPAPPPNSNQVSQTSIGYEPTGNMALYPRTYRPDSQGLPSSTNPSDAILAQTSYLARVMIQANDIYPPSHVSTRSSGETYASTIIPTDYNLKALTHASVYRNSLGATNTSSSSLQPGNQTTNNLDIVARDWVEFHLKEYCDPLAGSIGSNGLNNCNVALNSLSIDQINAAKARGETSWDLVGRIPGRAPYAADITANTLFSSKVDHPEAAMRYVYNLTNVGPTPLGQGQTEFTIPNDQLTVFDGATVLKDSGYNNYLGYMEEQSKLSLSQFALMKLFSERITLNNVQIPVAKWDKDGNKTVDFENTSRHGLFEFEANKRFQDPEWYDRVQQMPNPALLKEIAYMMSMQLSLDFKRYEQDQLQTAILASLGADTARMVKLFRSAQNQAGGSGAGASQAQQDAVNSQINDILDRFR